MTECPKCGNDLSSVSARFCPVCNHPLFDLEGTGFQGAARHEGVPWEHIGRVGLWSALVLTLKKCLTTPATFFTDLALSHNSYQAWLFALIIGSIGSLFNFIWSYLMLSPLLALVPGLDAYTGKNLLTTGQLIFAPLIVTAKLVVCACYFHFLLFCTGSKRQNLAATFRIVCYIQSTSIFDCVPIIGSVISLTWSLYLLSIGFNKIHKISMLRAWLIILLLPVVLAIFGGVVMGLMFGTGMILLDSLKDYLPFIR